MSPIDPRKTIDTPGTDPNKGMNARSFLISVIVALVVLLVVLFFVARKSSNGVKPVKTNPNSHLTRPAAPAKVA